MQVRVFMGVGAWLVGVGTATASSLVAVSLLGQGIAPSTSQQLSSDAVNRALAVETTEASASVSGSPSPTPSKLRPGKTPSPPSSQPQAQPQVGPAATRPSPTQSPQSAGSAASTPAFTVLTSQGGTVVARCPSGEAYLVSWSPTQGYEVGTVIRGPAATAQVTFDSGANTVTMVVSCTTGAPTATTTVSPVAGGTHSDE